MLTHEGHGKPYGNHVEYILLGLETEMYTWNQYSHLEFSLYIDIMCNFFLSQQNSHVISKILNIVIEMLTIYMNWVCVCVCVWERERDLTLVITSSSNVNLEQVYMTVSHWIMKWYKASSKWSKSSSQFNRIM